jgi:hypothetical protein
MSGSVTGLDEILSNLNQQIAGIEGATMAGLYEAGLKIEAASNARAPSEYGNLRGSSYTRRDLGGSLSVEIGYTAEYAAYVHENLEMKLQGEHRPSGLGVYWGPQGENKFLEKTLRLNEQNIVNIIRHHAHVGN